MPPICSAPVSSNVRPQNPPAHIDHARSASSTTEMNKTADPALLENARVEYAATNDAYIHYDDFTWKVGTVLIAGVFVFWGFLLDKEPDLTRLCWANLLICASLSVWSLYAAHNRQIYRYKLHRLHELEQLLGMHQHLRFGGEDPSYKITPPRGHWLNNVTYTLAALGGSLLGLFSAPYPEWSAMHVFLYLVNAILVIATLLWIRHIAVKTSNVLKTLRNATVPENSFKHPPAEA